MTLLFHSVDSEDNKIIYKAEYEYVNSSYVFEDKSSEGTTVNLKINDDGSILLNRNGKTIMQMLLDVKNRTVCYYKSDMGLEFELEVFTKIIEIDGKKLFIEYDTMYFDVKTNHKIWIKFN